MKHSPPILLLLTTALLAVSVAAHAQAQASTTPRVAPRPDMMFLDEHAVGRFIVQRWVSRESPEVSPAGLCECQTLVYEHGRMILDIGSDAASTTATVVPDITGDGREELVVSQWSGGAHCCESTAIYSVEGAVAQPLFDAATGNCPASLMDMDGDGVPEVVTCDDSFAYVFCSFGGSPMPPVVFAYARDAHRFVLATPRFAAQYAVAPLGDLEKTMPTDVSDVEGARCTALMPALTLMYTGREPQGQALFRRLYQRADAAAIEQKALAIAHASPLWKP